MKQKSEMCTTYPAGQHFVDNNTESPKVCFKAIILLKEDFWGRERGCANTTTRKIRARSRVVKQPGNTEVTDYNVPIGVDEDVLGLKVSMNNVVGVNMLDGKKLGEEFRGEQMVELLDSQAPPCKIVQLPHQVTLACFFEVFRDHPQGGTPISTMSKENRKLNTCIHTVTK